MEGDADAAQKELLQAAADAVRADAEERESRRPKNIGAGAVGLVGDSLGGVALGAAAIVVGPVAGYRESGAKGILKGAVGGLAIGVASTAIGIGSGIAKFVDGASAHADDKPLPVLEQRNIAENAEEDERAYESERAALYEGLLAENDEDASLGPPAETKLYDVLGVSPDANPTEIRRAYFRLAQRYHPDKNPNDPQATEKFQSISDAYQVLSDPVKRDEYHRLGRADTESLMDPKSLFVLMFGNDKFTHMVGDLATATIMSTMREQSEAGSASAEDVEKQMKDRRAAFQKSREEKLAVLLIKRLEPWVYGEHEKFIDHAKREILVLRKEPFGRDMLHTCGYVYRKKAALMLGKGKGPLGLHGFFGELTDKAHMFRSKAHALQGGMKMIQNTSTMNENETPEEAARREAVSVLGAIWLASVVDIQTTLRHVVKVVLTDKTVSKDILQRRAQGLVELGKIFQQA